MKFKNFAEATQVLAEKISIELDLDDTWQVLAAGEISIAIAAHIAGVNRLDSNLISIERKQDEFGFQKNPTISLPDIKNPKLLICDIGVETGNTAMLIADELHKLDSEYELALAALVVPRDSFPLLRTQFKYLFAARTPLVKRALRWEFEEFA